MTTKTAVIFLAMLFVMSIAGCGSSSSSTSSTPSTPTNVTATPVAGTTGEITISWTPVQDATSYNIYWSAVLPVGYPASPNPINVTTNTYTHTGLDHAATYSYLVTAVNGNVESPRSVQATAVPF